MKNEKLASPDYLFEVSWEVCNKVGGIYSVLSTKAGYIAKSTRKSHIFIGPDIWLDTERHPEFTEEPQMFRSWRDTASGEGLRVRTGHWNIEGSPTVILVDFAQFISRKDQILTDLWDKYGVDSITGNWDYIESALFGYAAGKVIESFVKYNLAPRDKAVAQFHDWSTGSGLLYLKGIGAPVATVLTCHSTVLGRCIAGRGMNLYDNLESYSPDDCASEYGLAARHSLEKHSAANADVLTTVSDITARECGHFLGRKVDIVTPNGIAGDIAPDDPDFPESRKTAREVLLKVASAMCGEQLPDNTVLIGTGGRYQVENKGIDIFIEALGRISRSGWSGSTICGFIFVPSRINGPDRELQMKLSGGVSDYRTLTTHCLMDPDNDPVLNRCNEIGLNNAVGSKVKLFFIPCYFNGEDGIFNMPYYDLLPGLDLTLYPSYYEPWGYTPLESLAFHVPTLTTSLAGFGQWVLDHCTDSDLQKGVTVVRRDDSNSEEVTENSVSRILEIAALSEPDRAEYGRVAGRISKIALWDNNIQYYQEAYSQALAKTVHIRAAYHTSLDDKPVARYAANRPSWAETIVNRQIPSRLRHLDTISKNLWWCWNVCAIDLFKSIDSELWLKCKQNPIAMLDGLTLARYKELEKDSAFIARLDAVYAEFSRYMEGKKQRRGTHVGYFSMEYGLDASLKIYSGGLGILAGDYLKESSDMKVKMTAIGLLYRYGYFTQMLSAAGDQVSNYEPQDFTKIPATPVRDSEGNWITVSVAFPGRNVYARIWRVDVGRTELYLLDTDFEDNLFEDRQITHYLYGGDWENRLKQELLLGIGGIRALRALGIHPDVYHCNEGHAAFIGLERLREYVNQNNLSYSEALEVVRSSSLFTTHTPVPAGHDAFTEDLLRTYISHLPSVLKTDWESIMALGKIDPHNAGEKFSMSILAANLSQEVNGVSWLHGKVSQDILANMWPGYLPEELHVSYVTNGVHYPTWTAPEWKEIHARVFGPEFQTHHYDKSCFEGIYKVSDEEIWNTRSKLRKRLIDAVKDCMSDTSATNHYSPRQIVKIRKTLRDDVLTIGFARRFATYKRAHLLFRNLDRLNEIVNNPQRPVQFLFAGKAHPADKAGQDLIKHIVEISKMPQFIGKIVFVPNYDINIAKLLVQGVDVWLNNPTRPLEASGTSGEKAVMNGVMHFSVLDGWWVEGYRKDAGWALDQERTYDDQSYQDELDSATIYATIENEIAPSYYNVDPRSGRSSQWIGYIKNTIAQVANNFTTNRMLTDYCNQYYLPQYERSKMLSADGGKMAKELAAWKQFMRNEWNNIRIISKTDPDSSYILSKKLKLESEVVLDLGRIKPDNIGVEMIFTSQDKKGKLHIQEVCQYELVKEENGLATYRAVILPDKTGMYQVGTRIYPKNPLLPHRQDIPIVKWL